MVKENRVIGQGYNGVASGKKHCVDGGCPRGLLDYSEVPAGADYNQYPCTALHAEYQAITDAGKLACRDATIYVTAEPCQQCTNMIEDAKIKEVIVWQGR